MVFWMVAMMVVLMVESKELKMVKSMAVLLVV
jgi:hypothetical protein